VVLLKREGGGKIRERKRREEHVHCTRRMRGA
jgi:hypothetical protein